MQPFGFEVLLGGARAKKEEDEEEEEEATEIVIGILNPVSFASFSLPPLSLSLTHTHTHIFLRGKVAPN